MKQLTIETLSNEICDFYINMKHHLSETADLKTRADHCCGIKHLIKFKCTSARFHLIDTCWPKIHL